MTPLILQLAKFDSPSSVAHLGAPVVLLKNVNLYNREWFKNERMKPED